jgi:hypothetical protein
VATTTLPPDAKVVDEMAVEVARDSRAAFVGVDKKPVH